MDRSAQLRFFLRLNYILFQSLVIILQEDKLEDANNTPDRFSSLADVTKVKNTGPKCENEYIENINNETDNAVNGGIPASYNLDVEDNSNVVEIIKTIIAVSGAEVVDIVDTKTVSDRCV